MSTTLHIVQRMAPGGLETLALRLVRELPGRHLLVSLEGDLGSLLSAWPALSTISDRLVAMEKATGWRPSLVFDLRKLMLREKASAVVTHHIGPLIYGGAAARLSGVDRVVHVEHDAWHYAAARRRALGGLAVGLVRPTLVAVSPLLQANARRMFPARRVELVTNGVDIAQAPGLRDQARRLLSLDRESLVIGSVGRLEHVKGHDVLIHAFARMRADATLVIVGDGSRRRALEDRAAALGVSDRVKFVGHSDDPGALYPAFDVLCLPSRAEGLPFVILEAQAAGVPVVASDVGDVRAAVCPQTGRLTGPEDVAALREALEQALEDAQAGSRSEATRGFIGENFNWDRTLLGYSRLIGV